MQTRLAPARVESIQLCSVRFKLGWHVSVGLCRRLLGLMAAASPVLPLGLLHMRPFLRWKSLGIRPSWPSLCLLRVSGTCFRALLVWRDPSFLLSVVHMGIVCHRQMIMTDGTLLGWGAVLRGMTGFQYLVRRVPRLAHKRPGVESGSSSSLSLSSIPDALACHRQNGQHLEGCP